MIWFNGVRSNCHFTMHSISGYHDSWNYIIKRL